MDDILSLLRQIIDDSESPYDFSDSSLKGLICSAAFMLTGYITFSNTYTINLQAKTISPDPSSSSDTSFINLVAMKAACMLARSEQRLAANKGISITDGPSSINGGAIAQYKKVWSDSLCADYQEMERQYRLGQLNVGKAIIGPYRSDDLSANYSRGPRG